MLLRIVAPRKSWRLLHALTLALLFAGAGTASAEEALAERFAAIDKRTTGSLGVYVKHLGTGREVGYQADRRWYLSSTVKVPLAVAVLQAVEDERLELDRELVLAETDFVDGAGDLLWHPPGTRLSIARLLEHSIENSDSVATDMLMRHLGVDAFNRQVNERMVAEGGLGPFTTILQVRYDAYEELHPRAEELSNMDYVEIRSAGDSTARVEAFQRKLGLKDNQLQADTLEEAFRRYYARGTNTGTLSAFGTLLERLVREELLNPEHTRRLLEHMAEITTGEGRLQAGLPDDIAFAQKTGTQIQQACNVGIVQPFSLDQAVVIVACAEDFGQIFQAEQAFGQVAAAVAKEFQLSASR